MVVVKIFLFLLLISILIPLIVSQKARSEVELPPSGSGTENPSAGAETPLSEPEGSLSEAEASLGRSLAQQSEVLSPEISIPAISIKEVIPEPKIKAEITVQDILDKMEEAYGKVEDYQCICITRQLSRSGRKMYKPKVMRLSFKRPDMMHAIGLQGVEEGAEAVFRDGKIKAIHNRYLPFIVFTFDADSTIARSPRHGLRIDKSGLGGLIERANHYHREGKIELVGTEKIEGRECYRLVMIPSKKEGKHPITQEILWVDKEKFLSIQHAIYEEGDRFAESRTFKDLKINIGLSDELFKPPKARWWRKKKE